MEKLELDLYSRIRLPFLQHKIMPHIWDLPVDAEVSISEEVFSTFFEQGATVTEGSAQKGDIQYSESITTMMLNAVGGDSTTFAKESTTTTGAGATTTSADATTTSAGVSDSSESSLINSFTKIPSEKKTVEDVSSFIQTDDLSSFLQMKSPTSATSRMTAGDNPTGQDKQTNPVKTKRYKLGHIFRAAFIRHGLSMNNYLTFVVEDKIVNNSMMGKMAGFLPESVREQLIHSLTTAEKVAEYLKSNLPSVLHLESSLSVDPSIVEVEKCTVGVTDGLKEQPASSWWNFYEQFITDDPKNGFRKSKRQIFPSRLLFSSQKRTLETASMITSSLLTSAQQSKISTTGKGIIPNGIVADAIQSMIQNPIAVSSLQEQEIGYGNCRDYVEAPVSMNPYLHCFNEDGKWDTSVHDKSDQVAYNSEKMHIYATRYSEPEDRIVNYQMTRRDVAHSCREMQLLGMNGSFKKKHSKSSADSEFAIAQMKRVTVVNNPFHILRNANMDVSSSYFGGPCTITSGGYEDQIDRFLVEDLPREIKAMIGHKENKEEPVGHKEKPKSEFLRENLSDETKDASVAPQNANETPPLLFVSGHSLWLKRLGEEYLINTNGMDVDWQGNVRGHTPTSDSDETPIVVNNGNYLIYDDFAGSTGKAKSHISNEKMSNCAVVGMEMRVLTPIQTEPEYDWCTLQSAFWKGDLDQSDLVSKSFKKLVASYDLHQYGGDRDLIDKFLAERSERQSDSAEGRGTIHTALNSAETVHEGETRHHDDLQTKPPTMASVGTDNLQRISSLRDATKRGTKGSHFGPHNIHGLSPSRALFKAEGYDCMMSSKCYICKSYPKPFLLYKPSESAILSRGIRFDSGDITSEASDKMDYFGGVVDDKFSTVFPHIRQYVENLHEV